MTRSNGIKVNRDCTEKSQKRSRTQKVTLSWDPILATNWWNSDKIKQRNKQFVQRKARLWTHTHFLCLSKFVSKNVLKELERKTFIMLFGSSLEVSS